MEEEQHDCEANNRYSVAGQRLLARQRSQTYTIARAMASVGTCVGLVQPGSLSFVHVESARASSTRLARSTMVRLALLLGPTCASLLAWWCMWLWCECCMALRRLSRLLAQVISLKMYSEQWLSAWRDGERLPWRQLNSGGSWVGRDCEWANVHARVGWR